MIILSLYNQARTLKSVVLFDVLSPEFTIASLEMRQSGYSRPVSVVSKASHGIGWSVSLAMKPDDRITCKVCTAQCNAKSMYMHCYIIALWCGALINFIRMIIV